MRKWARARQSKFLPARNLARSHFKPGFSRRRVPGIPLIWGEDSMKDQRVALLAGLLAAFGACGVRATPVTYDYFGAITYASNFAGVVAGDPVSIEISYDLASIPATASITSTAIENQIYVQNGPMSGEPWVTWIHATVSFDSYVFGNDLSTGTGYNVSLIDVYDSPNYDAYRPFYVMQSSYDYSFDSYLTWYAASTTNPSLVNGTSFPQPIDLTQAFQAGEFYLVLPGSNPSVLDFTLSRIDVPRVTSVPEPPTWSIAAFGLLGLLGSGRRRKR
jgi:MYXO-CTERM domain-containing protein